MITSNPAEQLRLQRGVEYLHRLGPRATAELLTELTNRIGGMPALMGLLTEYQRRLSPEMLRAAGGRHFPQRPLHEVRS